MTRIFSPLTWNDNESKEQVLSRIKEMDSEPLIAGIEINIPQFFGLFEPNGAEIKSLIGSLSKPVLGMCGLESKDDTMPQAEKIGYFVKALHAGVAYVDIEHTVNFREYVEHALGELKKAVTFFAPAHNLVVEHASFESTPPFAEACRIIEEMASYRPFLIKFITMVNDESDNKVFYRLLEKYASRMNIIAFGMGDLGLESRISSVHKGGYATYGHFGLASKACPGQIYYQDLAAKIKESVAES